MISSVRLGKVSRPKQTGAELDQTLEERANIPVGEQISAHILLFRFTTLPSANACLLFDGLHYSKETMQGMQAEFASLDCLLRYHVRNQMHRTHGTGNLSRQREQFLYKLVVESHRCCRVLNAIKSHAQRIHNQVFVDLGGSKYHTSNY